MWNSKRAQVQVIIQNHFHNMSENIIEADILKYSYFYCSLWRSRSYKLGKMKCIFKLIYNGAYNWIIIENIEGDILKPKAGHKVKEGLI